MAAIDCDSSAAVFRPAPESRRVSVYCVLGSLAVAGLIFTMAHWGIGPQRGGAETTAVLSILGTIALVPTVLIWRSAIRVDADGIWRRRIVQWDLWPWEAFA